MTVEEVARYLFVSEVHVQRLIERGDFSGASDDSGRFIVDDACAERHRARLEFAAKEYFNSQDESNDPLGL
jgi:excisionase family DNA binding protein